MSLIVAGTVRVLAENVDRFRPAMAAMMAASRAEARSVAGVCAASIGQTRRFSQSSSGMSSA